MSKPLKATVNCDMGEVSIIIASIQLLTVLPTIQGLLPVYHGMYQFIVDVISFVKESTE
jgi:hypothetical protein